MTVGKGMTVGRGVILVLSLAVVGVAIWQFMSGEDQSKGHVPAADPIAPLKPSASAPAGYRWDRYDGGDYVVWRLIDKEFVANAPRSGITVHFSRAATKPAEDAKLISKPGRFAGQDINWLVAEKVAEKKPADAKPANEKDEDAKSDDENADDSKTASLELRQDAFLDLKPEGSPETLKVHVWVWADTEPRLAELMKLSETISFSATEKK